jgi:flagellar hook-associated protein 3 FlgL
MAVNPVNFARVSNNMRAQLANRSMGLIQREMLAVQAQLTTGKRILNPSDDVGGSSLIMQLRRTLEQRQGFADNLRSISTQLAETDSAFASVSDLLRDAKTVASKVAGSTSTPDERNAEAVVIDSIYNQILALANKQSRGMYLFGGDRSGAAPFVETGGGVRWIGSSNPLTARVDDATLLPFMVDGARAFGGHSARVAGRVDLTPVINTDTRLADLRGTGGTGIARGSFEISDGTTTARIDLEGVDTVGDLINRINVAGVGSISAAVNATGTGIDIVVGTSDNLTVRDIGSTAAADLGIARLTPAGAGFGLTGQSVRPRVTDLTSLADLNGGAGIDLGGLTVQSDTGSTTIDLSGAVTVQDLLNRINFSSAGVHARINDAGTGIDIVNPVQGRPVRIAENGGTTAADLGVRSFDPSTLLSDLNDGSGVTRVTGHELSITDSAGVNFEIDLDGLETVQDVLDAINTASGGAGAGVTASFSTSVNGIVLTDSAGGSGTLSLANLNASGATTALGLDTTVAGNVLTGRDVAPVATHGVFSALNALRSAMRRDDTAGIADAAQRVEDALSAVTQIYGQNAAMLQEAERRLEGIEDRNLTTQKLMSEVEDVDYTEAIVRFQTLQTALQASLQTTGSTLNQSLLDFLR